MVQRRKVQFLDLLVTLLLHIFVIYWVTLGFSTSVMRFVSGMSVNCVYCIYTIGNLIVTVRKKYNVDNCQEGTGLFTMSID